MAVPGLDPAGRPSPWRWVVCGLLLLATTLNYMDRVALNQTSVRIRQAFGLSAEEYGWLEGGFSFAFAIGTREIARLVGVHRDTVTRYIRRARRGAGGGRGVRVHAGRTGVDPPPRRTWGCRAGTRPPPPTCGPARSSLTWGAGAAGGLPVVAESGYCGPTPGADLHDRLAELLRRYDVNDYAASIRVFAVRP